MHLFNTIKQSNDLINEQIPSSNVIVHTKKRH